MRILSLEIFVLTVLFSSPTFGLGFDCTTADKRTSVQIEIRPSLERPGFAIESDDIREYYQGTEKEDIGILVTDQKSKLPFGYQNERDELILRSPLLAKDSTKNLEWVMEFNVAQSTAQMVDIRGKKFEFQLSCKDLPGLE